MPTCCAGGTTEDAAAFCSFVAAADRSGIDLELYVDGWPGQGASRAATFTQSALLLPIAVGNSVILLAFPLHHLLEQLLHGDGGGGGSLSSKAFFWPAYCHGMLIAACMWLHRQLDC